LAGQTDFGQNQVPRIPADFVIVQFHNQRESIVMQRRRKSSRAMFAKFTKQKIQLIQFQDDN
jgi:hypothetical protein